MSELLTPAPPARGTALIRLFRPTLKYWMQTEVHVFGFSIAANVLLSLFPFLIVILSLCRNLVGWEGASNTIRLVIQDYFPKAFADRMWDGARDSLVRLEWRNLELVSVLLLLFTANGVFEPLEVALNKVWGIQKNRSFLKNQLISLGLIFACGSLALLSTVLTGLDLRYQTGMPRIMSWVVFKMAAVPVTILILFLIYWKLPNAKIPANAVLPPAIIVGLLLETLKYINLLLAPWWSRKLSKEYGPFEYSVTIILWSFLFSMLILAGAEWAARRRGVSPAAE